ncbi:MAG: ArsR/SmtB family transcription factor [Halobacteriaceae archaeon]
MSSLFPRRPPVDQERGDARVLRVDGDAADEVFAALGSETARTILGALYEEPGTATDVAEAADTSLQNARYHLEKLVDADLVEVVDTWYSDRGTEMTVYAPASEGVVVFAGDDEDRSRLRAALERVLGRVGAVVPPAATLAGLELLKRLLGAFALVGAVALLLDRFGPQYTPWGFAASGGGTPLGARPADMYGPDATGAPLVGDVSPAVVFVLGAFCAALLVLAAAAVQRRLR